MLKGFLRRIKPMDILSGRDIQAVHMGALEVLETTGVTFQHERALELFRENGCNVDFDNQMVRFPASLVEECIRKTPGSFKLKARAPANDLRIGGNRLHYLAGAGLRIVDLATWETRPATLKELDEASIVSDALDSIHIVADTAPYTELVGVPPVIATLVDIASHIRNTTKITMAAGSHDIEIFHIKMAKTVGVDMLAFLGSSAPLAYDGEAIEAAYRHAEAGFPFNLISSDMMGGTGPATIAGSLVTTIAETLAGVVLIQLIRPGAGIVAGDYTMPLDMRTGHPCFGDLGSSLHYTGFNQILRGYSIPTFANCPSMCSSKTIDIQSGYERALSTLAAALSGANLIVLHGGIYGEYTYHPAQAVLDDDIATWVGRFLEGFTVNDETLALDLIEEVGPIPGSYLGKTHTRKMWQAERFVPKTADRMTYPEWMNTGKKTALDYAKARTEEILKTHKVPPLPEDQDREIDNILKEAEAYYREKGML